MTNQDQDADNLKYIRNFLEINEIKYLEPEPGVFNYTGGSGQPIQIRYGSALGLKIGYEKRFGYSGVTMDHCYKITIDQEKQGIRTIWWKSFELEDRYGASSTRKRNVIQSYILAAAGKVKTKINGRDCIVKEITNKQARPFLEANSFYGYRSASLTYGLFTKKQVGDIQADTLVMVFSLGHPYYGRALYDLEVLRSSTLLDVQVLGGSSKLMKHIFASDEIQIAGKKIKYNSCAYYIDFCHNSGNSMKSLGFKFWKDSGGGLMNIDLVKGETFNRKPAMHKEIMKMMAEGRVVAHPLCGVRVYVWCKDGNYDKYGIKE